MARRDADADQLPIDLSGMADLVVDLWRIQRRANREGAATDAVRIACETAVDRLAALGFQFREMVGEPYHENLRVKVVHRDGGKTNVRISECLSPAVYFNKGLIRPAEVVVQGEE